MTHYLRINQRSLPRLASVGIEQLTVLAETIRNRALLFLAILTMPAIPFVIIRPGALPPQLYAVAVLCLLSILIPATTWQHKVKKGGNIYFLSLPVGPRMHIMARTLAGWAPVLAIAALVLTFFGIIFPNQAPLHGWIAPLVGATGLYFFTSAIYAATRKPYLWVLGLSQTPLILSKLMGPSAERTIESALKSMMVLFMGMGVGLAPDGSEILMRVALSDWLLMSIGWLALGLVGFLFAAGRHQDE